MKSIENNFDNPIVNTLLHYHFYQLRSNSPEGSTHVLDIEGLKVPSIKFWSIWENDKLIGCGVRSILNFAPVLLKNVPNVQIRSVDLSQELQILSYYLDRPILKAVD